METTNCPKTWMVESILVTIFCCLPFGIAGIVNASKVSTLFAQGNVEEAARASANAKKWTLWALGIGIAVYVIYIAYIAIFGAAMLSQMQY